MEKITELLRSQIKNIILVLVSGVIVLSVVYISSIRDNQLFSEEKIWYSRYLVVEDLTKQGLYDDDIVKLLLSEKNGDWTEQEIRKDLYIIGTDE